MTDEDGTDDGTAPSPDEVYEAMEPLEPYTTRELATLLGAPRRLVRSLLDALVADEAVRRKSAGRGRAIWIRDPPTHECPDCGYAFQVKFLHPVLSSVRLCPRCGRQLE